MRFCHPMTALSCFVQTWETATVTPSKAKKESRLWVWGLAWCNQAISTLKMIGLFSGFSGRKLDRAIRWWLVTPVHHALLRASADLRLKSGLKQAAPFFFFFEIGCNKQIRKRLVQHGIWQLDAIGELYFFPHTTIFWAGKQHSSLPDSFRGGYVKPEGHDANPCFVRPDNPQSKCPGVNLRLIVYCIIGDVWNHGEH